MGNVRLYGATSGYTELAPPAVAPDGVLSLPSGTGTLATAADVAAAGGKILQVVRATDSTNRTTAKTSFEDAGISVTITPQSATSAVLLIYSARMENYGTVDANFFFAQITDGNVAISGTEEAANGFANLQASAISPNKLTGGQMNLIGYVVPGVTTPVTYKAQFMGTAGTTTILNAKVTGQLYAIEVAA